MKFKIFILSLIMACAFYCANSVNFFNAKIEPKKKSDTNVVDSAISQKLENTSSDIAFSGQTSQNVEAINVSELRYSIIELLRNNKITTAEACAIARKMSNNREKIYILSQIAEFLGNKKSVNDIFVIIENMPPGNNRNQILESFFGATSGRLNIEDIHVILDKFSSTSFREDMDFSFDAIMSSVDILGNSEISDLMKNDVIATNSSYVAQLTKAHARACAMSCDDIQEGWRIAQSVSNSNIDITSYFFDTILNKGKSDPFALFNEEWISADARNTIANYVVEKRLSDQPLETFIWLKQNETRFDTNKIYSGISMWVAEDTKVAGEVIVKIESERLREIACVALIRELRSAGAESEAKEWETYIGHSVSTNTVFPTAKQ